MSTSGTETRSHARRRRILWISVAVGVATLIVVTTAWASIASRTKVARAGDIVALVDGWHFWPRGHDDVGYFGTISLVEGRCLGYREPSGGKEYLVIWPRGTEVEGSGDDIRIRIKGDVFRVGDKIDFGVEGDRRSADLDVPAICADYSAKIVYEVGQSTHFPPD